MADLQGRPLGGARSPYLWIDATYLKCRDGGRVSSCAVVSAAAGALLEEAEADALAYLDFPPAHHRRLRTNNVQERMNREIKRRANVVQVLPSRKSLIRLLGAVLSEMDEDWAARRWFTEESISEVFEDRRRWRPGRPPAYEGTAAEHAARIIAVVMADGGAVRKAA